MSILVNNCHITEVSVIEIRDLNKVYSCSLGFDLSLRFRFKSFETQNNVFRANATLTSCRMTQNLEKFYPVVPIDDI